MLTENEKKVLKILFTSFEDSSINGIARKCGLAPNGAMKILKKFEKEGVLKAKTISNIKSYHLNFENEKTKNILYLALIPELGKRIKFRFDDLKQLKDVAGACILFGSYIDLSKEPNDLDLLLILSKEKFKEYKRKSSMIYKTIPVEIHDILQTEEDFEKNIAKKDKVILSILKTGIILWGQDKIINLVENEHKKQA